MKSCIDCTSVDVVNNGRCREHYNEYMREYKKARYQRLRSEWIDRLGGVCVDCGTKDALEFDHVDASTKSFEVSEFHTHKLSAIAEEMKKCVLRCVVHHKEKTARDDLGAVGHGEGVSGKRNCPCSPCKERKAEYMNKYFTTHVRRR